MLEKSLHNQLRVLRSNLVAANSAAVDVIGSPAAVGLGTHDRGELVPAGKKMIVRVIFGLP